jgi:hypothetical protein
METFKRKTDPNGSGEVSPIFLLGASVESTIMSKSVNEIIGTLCQASSGPMNHSAGYGRIILGESHSIVTLSVVASRDVE